MIKDFIVNHKRSGIKMTPIYITIHNTGNEKSTARNERNWLTNPTNKSVTGYHVVIDEKEAIQVAPFNEVMWHAGDGTKGTGNTKSIGIEICESGNFNKTMENVIITLKEIMKELNLDATAIRTHKDWSGKNCPRLLLANHLGWNMDRLKQSLKSDYKDILRSKTNSPDKWIEFIEEMKNHKVGQFLPQLIESLGGK